MRALRAAVRTDEVVLLCLLMTLLVALVGCDGIPSPIPGPGGYDCDNPPAFERVLLKVKEPTGNLIVNLKEQDARPAALVGVTAAVRTRYTLTIPRGAVAATALVRILSDPAVAFMEEEGVKYARAELWNLSRLDQREWPPDDAPFAAGAEGEGVQVAVIDTGVDVTHSDLAGRALDGFSAFGGEPTDGHGHGTHVAGSCCGTKFGVAKKVKIRAIKVLNDQGSGTDSQVIAGLDWLTALKQANPGLRIVGNMSLGGGISRSIAAAACRALKAGVPLAIAAGNESADACTTSPADVKQALTVGAMDRNDRVASFSNYGRCLDLYGPGVDVESAKPGGGSQTFSGTSMATPHLAGILALRLARHPAETPAEANTGVIALATKDKLVSVPSGSPNLLAYAKEP